MDLLKAAFLGIIEGLTEFIPVSSTAHLLIASYLIDFQAIKNDVFEIVIQFSAVFAICGVYHKKIFQLVFEIKQRSQQKFILNLILAFLPSAIIGAAFYSYIKQFFFSNFTVAIALIVGGIFMILVDRKKRKPDSETMEDIKPLTAFYIGIFQSLAMIPGVSRSGATIVGGLLLGLNRKTAAEFSFFLAIPTITAASFYDLFKNASQLTTTDIEIILVGLLTSFFAAILVIKWFISFISKNNFVPFGVYRIIVGTMILILCC
jgi:undecaprenyl-diphosphatase